MTITTPTTPHVPSTPSPRFEGSRAHPIPAPLARDPIKIPIGRVILNQGKANQSERTVFVVIRDQFGNSLSELPHGWDERLANCTRIFQTLITKAEELDPDIDLKSATIDHEGFKTPDKEVSHTDPGNGSGTRSIWRNFRDTLLTGQANNEVVTTSLEVAGAFPGRQLGDGRPRSRAKPFGLSVLTSHSPVPSHPTRRSLAGSQASLTSRVGSWDGYRSGRDSPRTIRDLGTPREDSPDFPYSVGSGDESDHHDGAATVTPTTVTSEDEWLEEGSHRSVVSDGEWSGTPRSRDYRSD